MAIVDLASLKKNDFKETGIKGVGVYVPGSAAAILDERANAWTCEAGELHLWKVEEDNQNNPKPVAHLASYATGAWSRVVLVSEL